MMRAIDFQTLLLERGVLVIDGGLATELEAAGYNLAHPLWSGKILQDEPNAIEQVHLDYYQAGADIAISASYQASVQGFKDHLQLTDEAAMASVRKSVLLAQQARKTYLTRTPNHSRLLVAGSVGPYGAYLADGSEYRGNYQIDAGTLTAFHRPRIQALIEAGVDLLAIETMPSCTEIAALLKLLREEFPTAIAWISCTLRDAKHIADGTSVAAVTHLVNAARPQIVAFGVNCLPPSKVADFLNEARRFTSMPLVCYPNSGEQYDAESKTWSSDSISADEWTASVQNWIACGVKIIGGCCRTGPADIKKIAQTRSHTR